ncbi:MAG: vanomycin resistance protein VanB [Veillonellaceae bacterium]|nr:vanomycin resistance protein VanB [Veillonellaceae bacterium]
MNKRWLRTVAALAILASLTGGYALTKPLFGDRVYAGVALEGVELGGRGKEEVKQILAVWNKQQQNKQITVYYGDTIFKVDAQSIEFTIDVDGTLEEVWGVGRRGTLLERIKNIHAALNQGYRIPLRVSYNESKLDNLVDVWRDEIDRPAKNAALSIVTGGIIPQEQGRKLDIEGLRPLVLQALKRPEVNNVPLPVTLVYPSITVNDVARTGIKELLGSYTTAFNTKESNRTANIKLAAWKINGHIVYPGETFSFNEIVGPREKDYGFKEAMEFVDGELVPGIGGGVCQVSSTIYNAVLLANLNVIERYNHSKPLGYVPLGRDATVVYGALDFKFSNNTDKPIMVMAEVEGNKLHVGIFGQTRLPESIEILSANKQVIPPAVVKQPDATLFLGETKVDKQGKPGYEITTIRVVRQGGQEIRREVLSKDRYLPDNTIIKVGNKLPPFAVNK